VTTFDRANYYVKVSLDDKSLTANLSTVANCDVASGTCTWDSLAKWLTSRQYVGDKR
jgi:hypothetical protein